MSKTDAGGKRPPTPDELAVIVDTALEQGELRRRLVRELREAIESGDSEKEHRVAMEIAGLAPAEERKQ